MPKGGSHILPPCFYASPFINKQVTLAFDVELQKVEMLDQLRDILCFMLVVDPVKRPSALSILTSRELMALEKVIGV